MSVKALVWAWNKDLKSTEKLVLLALADHANDEDFSCFPSLDHIAKKCGLSRRAVINSVGKLEQLLIISKSQRGYKSNIYTLNIGGELNALVNVVHQLGSERHSPPSERGSPPSERGSLPLVNDVPRNHKFNHQVNIKESIPQWIDGQLWGEYLVIRKQKKAVNSDRALKVIINKLEKFKSLGFNPNSIIENSVVNSWKDVYEPKEKPASRQRMNEL